MKRIKYAIYVYFFKKTTIMFTYYKITNSTVYRETSNNPPRRLLDGNE